MSRQKGSLNRRTRAALSAAAEGNLAKGGEKTIDFLLKIANDPKRDDAVRMQAANILLPYTKPKLSAVEQTNINDSDQMSEADIVAKLKAVVQQHPALIRS